MQLSMLRRGMRTLWHLALLVPWGCTGEVEPPVSSAGPSQAFPLDREEESLVAALNAHRSAKGVAAVVGCTSLHVSASGHSDDMRDNEYMSDTAPDGSTPRTRACAAGYQAACAPDSVMAELVASGLSAGAATLGQWTKKADTEAIVSNPALVVLGVGRADGGEVPVWTVDLGDVKEASCE